MKCYYIDTRPNSHQISSVQVEKKKSEKPTIFLPASTLQKKVEIPTKRPLYQKFLFLAAGGAAAVAIGYLINSQYPEASLSSLYQNLQTRFFSWLNSPPTGTASERLTPIPLTQEDQAALAVRQKYSEDYYTSPISDFFGNTNSTIAKTIRLAAAQGELPKGLMTLASEDSKCNSGWCPSSALGETVLCSSSNVGTSPDGVPLDVKEAFCNEYKNSHFFVQNKLQYQTVEAGDPFPDAQGQENYFLERTERAMHSGKISHETRVQWLVNIKDKILGIMRYVRETHAVGPRKSIWDEFNLECTKKSPFEIECETPSDNPIDHAFGKLQYSISERVENPDCSAITETLIFEGKVSKVCYVLNPNNQQAFILPRLVNSELFNMCKEPTWKSIFTNTPDAKSTIPTLFPEGLPKTCEELAGKTT